MTTDRKGRANSAYATSDSSGWIGDGNQSPFTNLTTTGFTYSIWVMRTTTTTSTVMTIMGSNQAHNQFAIRGYLNGANVAFEYGLPPYDGSSFNQTGTSSLPVNEWHMATVTYTSSTVKFYWDAGLVSTVNSVTLSPTIGSLRFANNVNGWVGSIDDARIYNRPLSAAEITALYQNNN